MSKGGGTKAGSVLGNVDKRYTDKGVIDISHRIAGGKISVNGKEIGFSVMTRRYYNDGAICDVYNFDGIARQYAKDQKSFQDTKDGKIASEYQRPKDYEKFLDQKLNSAIELLETDVDKEFYKVVLAELKTLFGDYEIKNLGPSNKMFG